MSQTLKIYSWNVNGIRAAVKNGFAEWLKDEKPDIVCLQEIKINDTAREKVEFDFVGYNEYWHSAERPGYSGTAILTKEEPGAISRGFVVPGLEEKEEKILEDTEGRVLTLEFEKFFLINCYFPNANHKLSRLGFKEEFNEVWLEYVKKLEKKKPVVTCGDFNVAHEAIDLANPKENEGNAGFTKEERAWADKFLKHGLIDTYRLINGDKIRYSWWSYRFTARARNIGWRIDYFLVSEKLKKNIKDAFIDDTVLGSDHCPVGIILEVC